LVSLRISVGKEVILFSARYNSLNLVRLESDEGRDSNELNWA
jgi:hypothetical protein